MKRKYTKNWRKDITEKLYNFFLVPISFLFVVPGIFTVLLVYSSIISCTTPLPKDPNKSECQDVIRQLDCNIPYTKEEIRLAKEIFYSSWLEHIGDPDLVVGMNLDRICVVFTGEKWEVKNGFSMDGSPFPPEGASVIGQTFNRSYVKVYSSSIDTPLYTTSFAHELVHASLMALGTEGDPDHLGNKYDGWTRIHNALIKEVNLHLALMDL